jgi:hypothetical protein
MNDARPELVIFEGKLTGEIPDHRALREERLDRCSALQPDSPSTGSSPPAPEESRPESPDR